MNIAIQSVTVPERMRDTTPSAIISLAESMDQHGQLQPIIVRQVGLNDYRLVAGAHRLAAAKHLLWTEIAATLAQDHGDPELNECHDLMVEIDENLKRVSLTPVQVGQHELTRRANTVRLEARKGVLEAEARAAKEKAETGRVSAKTQALKDKRSARETQKSAESFRTASSGTYTKERAEETGKSERTVQAMLQRAAKLQEAAQRAGLDVKQLVATALDTDKELNKLPDMFRIAPQATVEMLQSAAAGNPSATPTKLQAELKAQELAERAERNKRGTPAEQDIADYLRTFNKTVSQLRVLMHEATRLATKHKDTADGAVFNNVSLMIEKTLVRPADGIAVSLLAGTAVEKKANRPAFAITDNNTPEGQKSRKAAKAAQEANSRESIEHLKSHGIR